MKQWYEQWFNEDYLALYAHRNAKEADDQVANLITLLNLQTSQTVLDIGCGSGRHSIAFAKRGFCTTGIDLSKPLLEIAQKNAFTEGLEIVFIEKDMRHLNGLGPFDLACSLFTSFGYFEEKKEDQKMLQSISNTLGPDGIFVLDYLNPEYVSKNLNPKEEMNVGENQVSIRRYIEGDQAIKEIVFPEKTYTEKVRLYSHEELESLLISADLHPSHTYANAKGDAWFSDSARQLIIAHKKL